jgi:phosphoglycolate phosphatase-like HAD superfamily hydrolase
MAATKQTAEGVEHLDGHEQKTPAKVAKFEDSIKNLTVTIRGRQGSPLVVHAFAEKAKEEIRQKQQKKAKKAKEERKPTEEFEAAKYRDEEGRECVPITALKKSLITAATAFDGLTKVALRQALFVDCVANPGSALVPIEQPGNTANPVWAKGVQREDAVTIGINTRGLCYRPEYKEWQLRIRIEYNDRLVSEEQLTALLKQAGWGVGICEGRPERSSALGWGRFEVVGPF